MFCDKTLAALETFATLHHLHAEGTILFLKLMIRFWKVVNVQSPGADIGYRDKDSAIIRSLNDPQLEFLSAVAIMVEGMTCGGAKMRIGQLTQGTSKMIAHTCRGLVHLSTSLLASGQDFVILGWFTTHLLQKCFEKLRQGSGVGCIISPHFGNQFYDVEKWCPFQVRFNQKNYGDHQTPPTTTSTAPYIGFTKIAIP